MILKQLTCLSAAMLLLCSLSFAQNPWKFTKERDLEKKSGNRLIIPNKYRTIEVDLDMLSSALAKAPLRFTQNAENATVTLELPIPTGSTERFVIVNAPVMHPILAAKFPEIQTYAGYGVDDPSARIRLDLGPQGFHGMILSSKHSGIFIEPYEQFDMQDYIVYYKKDNRRRDRFTCHFDEANDPSQFSTEDLNTTARAGDCILRTYRLALACTGEYAQFHGGTEPLVMAAYNTSMNRVNGIFENDISVTMELVPNTNQLIFYDGNTDPFTNNSGFAMLDQNQTTCDNTIGSNNYDIGHVFSTGGGGVASLQSPCTGGKARGVTGSGNPVGDPFDVDYVAHEMGHQYGGNHTQNNDCNRSNASYEPGSASTIMGYAGICPPDVQNNSDAYFHAISIQEMSNFVTGNGNNCAVQTVTGNNPPTANAGSNYTIPHSTPFVLTATGSDPDDPAAITYCWEQFDNEVAPMSPQPTNTNGPAFRSVSPVTSPMRYFPNLAAVVNNTTPTWEVLASVARTYNFRLTVRDNNDGSGCTAEDNMAVDVDGNSGPFVVTAPNTAICWEALSQETVSWDVANTDQAPINVSNVDILLSTDGGFNYTMLASNVPNTGSANVTVPNTITTTARIMVIGVGNIFFDISDVNFEIKEPQNSFVVTASPNTISVCAPDEAVYTIDVASTGTFTGTVNLSASGNPAGTSATFSNPTINTAGTSTLTIGNTAAASNGTYTITISATDGTDTKTVDVTFILAAANPSATVLNNPANGATNISLTPTFDWNALADADSYALELALDAGFTNMVENPMNLTSNTYTVANNLQTNTTYFWRVRASNNCGDGDYSAVFSFTTENTACNTYDSSDTGAAITGSTISSTLNIVDQGTISDIDINLDIPHSWVGDLIISIEHNGVTVLIMDNPGLPATNFGCDGDNVLATFDDDGTDPVENECANSVPTIGGILLPEEALSAFNGMEVSGTWTITIEDTYPQDDDGTLAAWGIGACYQPPASQCPNMLPLTGSETGTNDYEADGQISSVQIIEPNADVDYDAGNCIELNPGFEVKPNAEFDAFIDGCGGQ